MTALHLREALSHSDPNKFSQTGDDADIKSKLEKLQAHILKGHGRDHAAHVFIVFRDGKASEVRTWLSGLAGRLTTAWQQLEAIDAFKSSGKDGGLLTTFHLSAKGYEYLGLDTAGFEAAFRDGMKNRALGDPAIDDWERPFRDDLHALVLMAHSSEATIRFAAEALRTELCLDGVDDSRLADSIHIEVGKQRHNAAGAGIEHFGYVDGRSQPIFFTDDVDEESDGRTLWDPTAPLRQVLAADPHGQGAETSGSYFVFRKLEQDVRGFKSKEQELATALNLTGKARELAGAYVVGRFEDGTPVVLSDTPIIEESAGVEGAPNQALPNNFDYRGDPAGLKCPFHAHIRKSNPRGTSPGGLESDRERQMARRGITYGDRADDGSDIDAMPGGGVGLLFMSYQNDIADKFEFIQKFWVDNSGFPQGGTGVDPVIGTATEDSPRQTWPLRYGSAQGGTTPFGFDGFVKMLGGEYFFAPSISFFDGWLKQA